MGNNFSTLSKIESTIAIAFFVLFCWHFIPSPNHEIRIHDTFDGNFSTRHVLINSGNYFNVDPDVTVPGIMNGLPRGVFPRFTELIGLLMYFFGSLSGFVLAFLFVRLIAFFGIYLFGKDHLLINNDQKGLLIMVSVAFACLPFFIIQGITVAGIPFLLWAFFNLLKKEKIRSSLSVFVIFGLWSHLVLVGFHSILILGALALLYSLRDKKIHWWAFLAVSLLGVTYILSDYMLFYLHYFNSEYHSSRGEFEKHLGLNFNGVIGGTFKHFVSGDYSSTNYFGLLFMPFIGYYIYSIIKERKIESEKLGLIFLIVLLLCSFLINLLDWKGFAFFYEKFGFAKVFNFKRFTNILPGLFFLIILISLIRVNKVPQILLRVLTGISLFAFFILIWRGNISHNRSAFDTSGLKIISEQQVTFNQFFDPELYSKIKKEIGADSINNVIHFGLSPSPSKYAGLNVLDDYQGDYPKGYKIEFRKIISDELEESTSLKEYYDSWGARCYLESAKTFENKLELKNGMLYEPELSINTSQLKAMNCGYILSNIVIGNSNQLKLTLQKVLVSAIDRKTILLYKINT